MRNQTARVVAIAVLCAVTWVAVPTTSEAQRVKARRPSRSWITDMAASGDDLDVCTRKGGIFRSTDDGRTWKKISLGDRCLRSQKFSTSRLW
jgi:photosystem II stability/assembly factor-like uncharacterized protein